MMHDATRLAAKGKYCCRLCNKIDNQENGVVIAFLGNILLAICPTCIRGPIVITRDDTSIRIEMPRPSDNRVVLASDIESHGIRVANPSVKKVSL